MNKKNRDFTENELRELFKQIDLMINHENAVKDYFRYRQCDTDRFGMLTKKDILSYSQLNVKKNFYHLKFEIDGTGGGPSVNILNRYLIWYLNYKNEIAKSYESNKSWDDVIAANRYADGMEGQEPFIDYVEDVHQVKIVDARQLQEVTGITKLTLDELAEVLKDARYSKYTRALQAVITDGGKYYDLMKVKPQRFGLPKLWKGKVVTDQKTAVSSAIALRYLIQNPDNSVSPDLDKIAQEMEAPEAALNEIKKLFGEGGNEAQKHIKMAIHALTQFYGDNKQLSLFSDEKIDAFSKNTGLIIANRPKSYGVILNESQTRVLEGILKAFSDSNYKGSEEVDKFKSLQKVMNTGSGTTIQTINKPYQNIDKIPVVKLTQAHIIKLSGYDLKSQRQGDKIDVIEAISFLATKQFCFYWVRLKTEKGKPVKDKNGDYVKEEVMEVGTIFRIKTVRTEEGELQYYEIHPSAALLDQVNSYFLLVPNDWRDEVKKLTGKRASSYTYQFLLWLRLQNEQIRRYNSGKNRKKKPFKITKSWEEVAIALKMPKTMYKTNRKRASKIIQEAYSVAIKLGYLQKVENNGATDMLCLNEGYYPKPGELV